MMTVSDFSLMYHPHVALLFIICLRRRVLSGIAAHQQHVTGLQHGRLSPAQSARTRDQRRRHPCSTSGASAAETGAARHCPDRHVGVALAPLPGRHFLRSLPCQSAGLVGRRRQHWRHIECAPHQPRRSHGARRPHHPRLLGARDDGAAQLRVARGGGCGGLGGHLGVAAALPPERRSH